MTWIEELSIIDAWMRSYLGPGWLRGDRDREELSGFLVRSHRKAGLRIAAAVHHLCPMSFMRRVEISDHAVRRWKERCGAKYTDRVAKERLATMVDQADEVRLKPQYRARQVIAHGFEEATYYHSHGWILVVVDGELKTVHGGEAKKWQPATDQG